MDDLDQRLRCPDSRARTSRPSIDNRYISSHTSESYKQEARDTLPIVKDSACVGVCRHNLQPLMRDALVLLGLSFENIDKVQLALRLLSVPHMSKDVNPHLLRSDLGK